MRLTDKFRQLLALALAVTLFLTGCNQSTDPKTPAMGRYVEEALSLPGDMKRAFCVDMLPSGEIYMIGESNDGLKYWLYDGKEWSDEEPEWFSAIDGQEDLAIHQTDLDPEGVLYGLLFPAGGYGPAIVGYYTSDGWQSSAVDPLFREINPDDFRVLPGGGIVAGYYNTLIVYSASGNIIGQYTSNDRLTRGNFGLVDGSIAFTDGSQLKLYSLDTGELTADLALQRGDSEQGMEYITGRPPQIAFCWDETRQVICYAGKSGIYQMSVDGQLTEKLVDGSLTSLVTPSVDIRQLMAHPDGSFYLYAISPDYMPLLFRYSYDPNTPTTPNTELRIYSLYDSPTIRQAMGSFQRSNPEVTVRYEVGAPEDGSISTQDALHQISAQLLAGEGADLLVLDFLPIEDYREKGVFTDLGELDADLFPNIANTFRQDGTLYAVPAAFYLPLLIAEPHVVDQVQTPQDLAAYLAEQDNPRIGVDPNELFWWFARYYLGRWISDGALDAPTFAEDLAAFKQIKELLEQVEHPRGGAFGGDYLQTAILFKEYSLELRVTDLFAINNLRGPYTAFQERSGTLTFYPQQEQYFLPSVILAVNAGGSQPELARRFIDHVLSKEQQLYELGEGLPVNRAAYREQLDAYEPNEHTLSWTMDKVNPATGSEESVFVEFFWPDMAFRQQMMEMAEAVSTPLVPDETARAILGGEAYRYLTGEISLEEAVQAAEQAINLYFAE